MNFDLVSMAGNWTRCQGMKRRIWSVYNPGFVRPGWKPRRSHDVARNSPNTVKTVGDSTIMEFIGSLILITTRSVVFMVRISQKSRNVLFPVLFYSVLATSHKQKKRVAPLTLIVGSDALKGISTKRLSNRVRVKTFDRAQIQQLREKLNAMNLEPYEKIVLHIGECDVSAGSDVETVSSNMHELLLDLRAKFTVAVSGMLPMKGFNIKAFNSEIKKLCGEYDVEYIDHHDSFAMASGEVPRSLFYGKNQSLRPAGTATLVSNLDSKCSILRKHDADMTSPHKAGEIPSNPLYI